MARPADSNWVHDGTPPEGIKLGFDEELESPWEQLRMKLRAGPKAPGMDGGLLAWENYLVLQ